MIKRTCPILQKTFDCALEIIRKIFHFSKIDLQCLKITLKFKYQHGIEESKRASVFLWSSNRFETATSDGSSHGSPWTGLQCYNKLASGLQTLAHFCKSNVWPLRHTSLRDLPHDYEPGVALPFWQVKESWHIIATNRLRVCVCVCVLGSRR